MSAALLFLLCGPVSAAQRAEPDVYCGSRCLFMALHALEIPVPSYEALEEALGAPQTGGYSMQDLASAAERFGARTLAVQTTLDRLTRRPGRFACIAHVKDNHFVLLTDVRDGVVTMVDGLEKRSLAAIACNEIWSGKALLISRQELLPEEDLPQPRSWWTYGLVGGCVLACGGVWIGWRRRWLR